MKRLAYCDAYYHSPSSHLNIMLRELLCQRATATGSRVNRVVNGYLAIFMVQPGVNIFAAFLQNLLS